MFLYAQQKWLSRTCKENSTTMLWLHNFITYMRKTSVINCLSLQILKGEIISYYKEISWQIVSSKVTHKTPTKQ